MKLTGYGGNVLFVNLTNGEIKKEPLDKELAEKYIGGWGLGQKQMYDYMPVGKEPLAPENPIIINPGMLTGTLSPGTSKVIFTSKDPASGAIASWFGSLHFGAKLKWAGYDSVIITGKSSKPVYLRIKDDEVEICDASDLWGKKDLYDTTDILKERLGESYSIAAIGPAGENLVKISIMIIDSGTSCGRTMGCSMGSKNLKAIAVDGTKGQKVADIKRYMGIVDRLVKKSMSDPLRNSWKELGLYFIWPLWDNAGYLTRKNATETASKDEMETIYGANEYRKYKVSVYGCPTCLTPDKGMVKIREGEFKGLVTRLSTTFHPAFAFGRSLAVGGLDNATKLCDMANRFGIDYMTFPSMVGWLIDLYERGIITKKDTNGLELKESFGVAKTLLEQTVKMEGLGAIIAEGFIGGSRKLGRGSEKYAHHIKGTEADFDGRASLGLEVFSSVVNVRPSRDLPIGGVTVAKGRKPEFYQKVIPSVGYLPEDKIAKFLTPDGFDLPRLTAHYEYWAAILDTMGICFRMPISSLYNVKTCAELYSAATGIEKTDKELLKDAERAFNLARFLNAREGFSRKDDRFPDSWFKPLKRPDMGIELTLTDYFGKKHITREDSEQMLSDYYDEHGWDVKTGNPTKEKLLELGLDKAAAEFDKIQQKN
jgi:aldehyde:ferredoxin oxidoreductase